MEGETTRKSRITWAVEVVSILLVLILAGLVSAQVFMRYIMDAPLTWSEEAARITFIWVTFIGAGLAFQRRENLRIQLLPDVLPLRPRLWLRLVIYAVEVAFMGLVLYESIPLLWRLYPAHTPALDLTQDVFYGGVAGGGLVILGYALVGLRDTMMAIRQAGRNQ
ncbi:MAG: C4-dicarboxylate transport system (Permease small protein) [candidate division NC10 bacterium]|jgi:TRAP-type C4-dicarboxylate transport system permease small subunit|nr:C4-dicarboxylate transport system (Permease small protein) [candidate division NC10 bacterium]